MLTQRCLKVEPTASTLARPWSSEGQLGRNFCRVSAFVAAHINIAIMKCVRGVGMPCSAHRPRNIGTTLAHCGRCHPNIEPTLVYVCIQLLELGVFSSHLLVSLWHLLTTFCILFTSFRLWHLKAVHRLRLIRGPRVTGEPCTYVIIWFRKYPLYIMTFYAETMSPLFSMTYFIITSHRTETSTRGLHQRCSNAHIRV